MKAALRTFARALLPYGNPLRALSEQGASRIASVDKSRVECNRCACCG